MESIIYYFSGTGNSYKIAKDMTDKLGNTKLIKICSDNMHLASENEYKKVGIIFPIYYFTLPKIVEEFVRNLKIDNDSYVFAIATCGGQVGFSLNQLKDILIERGVSLSAGFSITMPDNYQVMFSPISMEKQQKLFTAADEKLRYIIDKVKKSEVVEIKGGKLNKLFIKFMKEVFKPKNKDKNFWVDEKCNGCGICSRVCPVNNIEINNNKPKWLHNCEHCLACMQWCPKYSIQYRRSTVNRGRYYHPEIGVKEMIGKDN